MARHFVEQMFIDLMPHIVIAGRAARIIQKQLGKFDGPAQKTHGNAFAQALTDADGAIQTQLALALLAEYPGVRFIGEEKDAVSKYFDPNATVTVTLDPINGTHFYENGLDLYELILTVRDNGRIVGALVYLPAREVCYSGIDGAGATMTHPAQKFVHLDLKTGPIQQRFVMPEPNKVILGYKLRPELRERLASTDYQVVDMNDYVIKPDPNWKLAPPAIFTGEVAAIIKENALLIDWGAVGYIVSQAGGYATSFAGEQLHYQLRSDGTERTDSLVASAGTAVHDMILNAINR